MVRTRKARHDSPRHQSARLKKRRRPYMIEAKEFAFIDDEDMLQDWM